MKSQYRLYSIEGQLHVTLLRFQIMCIAVNSRFAIDVSEMGNNGKNPNNFVCEQIAARGNSEKTTNSNSTKLSAHRKRYY